MREPAKKFDIVPNEDAAVGFEADPVIGQKALHHGAPFALGSRVSLRGWVLLWATDKPVQKFLPLASAMRSKYPRAYRDSSFLGATASNLNVHYLPSEDFPRGGAVSARFGMYKLDPKREVDSIEIKMQGVRLRWHSFGFADGFGSIVIRGSEPAEGSVKTFEGVYPSLRDWWRLTLPRHHRKVLPDLISERFAIRACLNPEDIEFFGKHGDFNEDVTTVAPNGAFPSNLVLKPHARWQNMIPSLTEMQPRCLANNGGLRILSPRDLFS